MLAINYRWCARVAARALLALVILGSIFVSAHQSGHAAGIDPQQRQLQQILARRALWEHKLKADQHQEWLLQQQLTTTRGRLSSQQQRLQLERESASVREAHLIQAVQADEIAVSSAQGQLHATRVEYVGVHRQAHKLLVRLRRLKARIHRELGNVQGAIVEIYELSQVSPLETVLEAKSLTTLLRQQDFVSEIGSRDTSILLWARHEHALVYKAASAYLAKLRELRALRSQQATQLKLVIVETERENLVLLQTREATQRKQESIKRMEASILALGQQEQQQLADKSTEAQTSQKMILEDQQSAERVAFIIGQETGYYPNVGTIPGELQWPVVGPITQDFGPSLYAFEPPLTYQGHYYPHFHTGIDIAAPFESPIRAAAAGRVIFGSLFVPGQLHVSYGLCVIIMHTPHLSTLYAHLDNTMGLKVTVGQVVAAGQIIGYEGMTGNTTGPHLHFEVRVNGNFVNPLGYLPPEPPI